MILLYLYQKSVKKVDFLFKIVYNKGMRISYIIFSIPFLIVNLLALIVLLHLWYEGTLLFPIIPVMLLFWILSIILFMIEIFYKYRLSNNMKKYLLINNIIGSILLFVWLFSYQLRAFLTPLF